MPPGFELEQGTPAPQIQLPTGFELEQKSQGQTPAQVPSLKAQQVEQPYRFPAADHGFQKLSDSLQATPRPKTASMTPVSLHYGPGQTNKTDSNANTFNPDQRTIGQVHVSQLLRPTTAPASTRDAGQQTDARSHEQNPPIPRSPDRDVLGVPNSEWERLRQFFSALDPTSAVVDLPFIQKPLDKAATRGHEDYSDAAGKVLDYSWQNAQEINPPGAGTLHAVASVERAISGLPAAEPVHAPAIIRGPVRAIAGRAGEITYDPRQWAFFLIPGGALGPAVTRALSLAYTGRTGFSAWQQAKEITEIWGKRGISQEKKYEAITNLILDSLMASVAAKHATRPGGAFRPTRLAPALADQVSNLPPEAKQEIFSRLQAQMPLFPDGLRAGDTIVLPNGRNAQVLDMFPKMGRALVQLQDGQTQTLRLDEMQPQRPSSSLLKDQTLDQQLSLFQDDENRQSESRIRPQQSKSRKNRMPTADNKFIDYSRTIHHDDGSKTFYDFKGRAVTYGKEGFPDFSPYAKVQVKVKGLTGRWEADRRRANKAAGLTSMPEGYTWHHVEGGELMQLIPQDINDTFPHTGGAADQRRGNRRN